MLQSQTLTLLGIWLLYFLLHSILASLRFKHWVAAHWPALIPVYRLLFNLIALLFLIPPLLIIFRWQGPYLWRWHGAGWWIANGLALIALWLFIWSLRYYDSKEFFGIHQWQEGDKRLEDQERFHISPLHRFIRHPWYSLGMVLIWTRDMTPPLLVSAILISLYFILGSRLEERKLLVYHNESYRRYKARVPGLIPMPWRYLSKHEAQELVRISHRAG